jgi:hypothetical protein
MRTVFSTILPKLKKINICNARTLTPEEIEACKKIYTPPLTAYQIHWKRILDKLIPDTSEL